MTSSLRFDTFLEETVSAELAITSEITEILRILLKVEIYFELDFPLTPSLLVDHHQLKSFCQTV